jgi:hypothetical protein
MALDDPEARFNAYEEEMSRIRTTNAHLHSFTDSDLAAYREFADSIQEKWKGAEQQYYGRLMVQICGVLNSVRFEGSQQEGLARKYALSALEDPNALPLTLELELSRFVVSSVGSRSSRDGEDFARRRREDLLVRLHAWRRLLDAVDLKWDPNDTPVMNVSPPAGTGMPAGIAPEAIANPALRAQYEQAIEANRQKNERFLEQHAVHRWLLSYPGSSERLIIHAYSATPYDSEELETYLDKYRIDEEAKARILAAVAQSIERQERAMAPRN